MNDEIKEILEELNKFPYGKFYGLKQEQANQIKMLLDYITNLQEENERLKELVNPKTQIFIDTEDMEERYGRELYEDYLKEQVEDYKSRNEKAVEYINENWGHWCSNHYKYATETINILNGDEDE